MSRTNLLTILVLGTHPGPAAAGGDLVDVARELHGVGTRHFAAGEYQEAAKSFRAALVLADRPSLHFNLACALEAQGELADAVAEYELYLGGRPDAPDRDDIRALVRWLKQAAEARGQVPRPGRPLRAVGGAGGGGSPLPLPGPEEPGPLTTPRAGEPPSRLPAYLTLGCAGAAALVAGWFGVQAMRADARFDASRLRADSAGERGRAAALAQEAREAALTADLVGAGALVAAGVGTWLLLQEPEQPRPKRRRRFALAP